MGKQFGQVVTDIDAATITSDEVGYLKERVLKHGLVILKNQNMSVKTMEVFTSAFGVPTRLSDLMAPEEHEVGSDCVVRVSNILPNGDIIPNRYATTQDWHTDGDIWESPKHCVWNMLYGVRVPSVGGATAFADCHDAYLALTPEQKKRITGKKMIVDFSALPNMGDAKLPVVKHDMLTTHLLTGKPHLYVSGPVTSVQMEGYSKNESFAELTYWHQYITRPENMHVHQWTARDLIIWDNLTTMHRPLGDYGNEPRLLYKTQARITSRKG